MMTARVVAGPGTEDLRRSRGQVVTFGAQNARLNSAPRFNRGLGLAIRKRLCQSFDFEIQALRDRDAVLLAFNSRGVLSIEKIGCLRLLLLDSLAG
jgi:hypothetical protein